jgi:predicted lipoprotein with Yx(FWY)xxD motif
MRTSQRRLAQRTGHPIGTAAAAVGLTSALAVSFVAAALAVGTVTIGSQQSSKLGVRVVVNAQGHTLYSLSGESRTRQFCTSSECLRFWPPLRASSKSAHLKATHDVKGQLRVLTRHGAIVQVTLRGVPLYRFSGDRARGEVNGEGIVGPGGHVWHAVTAASSAHAPAATSPAAAPPAMPMPSPTPPSPPPSYPPTPTGY